MDRKISPPDATIKTVLLPREFTPRSSLTKLIIYDIVRALPEVVILVSVYMRDRQAELR